jgi:penicillin-binding protein 2
MGVTGVERLMDKELRGIGGRKSVLVNNLGLRQRETVWSPAEPGQNVVLTIDLKIQEATEVALQQSLPGVRGAVVVMDARTGDVVAMASAPAYDPNFFAQRHDAASWAHEMEYLTDTNRRPQINRAMYENYPPGSIFKIVVGLAALERGVLDPREIYQSPGAYPLPGRREPIGDLAGSGPFDFDRALAKSSNCYFIYQGLKPGVLARIIALGQKLHLGERTDLLRGQEARGHLPSQREISSGWYLGDTAYLSIGQGRIAVTPLQMAVMTSAVANGGTVFWPRLVERVEPYGGFGPCQTNAEGRVRDTLGVSQRSLNFVREAMLADVERPDGTGHSAAVPGLHIAGKTGTAQVEKNGRIDKTAGITWFVSYASVGGRLYAVVAMVESGVSGGGTCAPIARKVYEAIYKREQERDRKPAPRLDTLAQAK